MNQVNNFVKGFSSYQLDGEDSVSGPKNWLHSKNLVDAETELSRKIPNLIKDITEVDNVENCVWQFYIGSPGNGKSHLAGKIQKGLLEQDWEKIVDEQTTQDDYLLKFRLPSKGPKAKLWFLQDASEVKDINDRDSDPVRDTLQVLEEAYRRKISLIICVNRGILESALEQYDRARDSQFHKLLKLLLNEKKEKDIYKLFSGIKLYKEYLDEKSIFRNSVTLNESTAEGILNQILDENKWQPCMSCDSQIYCPFYQNKNSLQEKEKEFIKIIRNTEYLSGQTIVLREFLAILSIILSGSSKKHSKLSPCKWVHKSIADGDKLSLFMSRYFNVIFSDDDSGLDKSYELREDQIKTLKSLNTIADVGGNAKIKEFLESINRKNFEISSSYGMNRLYGAGGLLNIQDPILREFSTEEEKLFRIGSKNNNFSELSGLDKWFAENISDLVEIIDNSEVSDFVSSKQIKLLQRWASSFLIRKHGFDTLSTNFGKEIGNFADLIRSFEQKDERDFRKIKRKFDNDLGASISIIDSGKEEGELDYSLSKTTTVLGLNIQLKINEKAFQNPKLRIPCVFIKNNMMEESDKVHIFLTGLIYIWINKANTERIMRFSLPRDIVDTINNFRNRAIAVSNYSRDSVLRIETDTKAGKMVLNVNGEEVYLE